MWTYLLTFALGLLSGLVLFWLAEKRRAEKALSERVYMPLHGELSRALEVIQARSGLEPLSVWPGIKATGLARKIDSATREKLNHMYGETLPGYGVAWSGAFHHVDQMRRRWDADYGVPPPRGSQVGVINWSRFLLSEALNLDTVNIMPGVLLPLFARYISPKKLAKIGMTIEQFLQTRWEEAQDEPPVQEFQAKRKETLAEIEETLNRLAIKIRV